MRSASPAALRFRNSLALIGSIDRHELEAAEVIKPGPDGSLDWACFLQTPISWILRLDDDRLDRLFELMETRGA